MWERWNQTTHIFEKSDNDGASWVSLPLDAAILNEGLVATARLGSGTANSASVLHGDQVWRSTQLPVGSLYWNANVSTNPATLLGYGTWTAYGPGRCVVCLDSGQTEFDTLNETGGAKTHTLTTAELAVHTHVQDAHAHALYTYSTGGVTVVSVQNSGRDATQESVTLGGVQSATAVNQNAGSGSAHNNLQPYIVAYCWQRTA